MKKSLSVIVALLFTTQALMGCSTQTKQEDTKEEKTEAVQTTGGDSTEDSSTKVFVKEFPDLKSSYESKKLKEEDMKVITKNPKYSHLEGDKGDYGDVLRYLGEDWGDVKYPNAEGKDVTIKEFVKNKDLPTLFIFTWIGCEYCDSINQTLKENYKEADFNLILAEAHTIENKDGKDILNTDIENVKKHYKEKGIENFVDYAMFNTDKLFNEITATYYPTLIYMDKNNKIVNVSPGLKLDQTMITYQEIQDIFKKSLE